MAGQAAGTPVCTGGPCDAGDVAAHHRLASLLFLPRPDWHTRHDAWFATVVHPLRVVRCALHLLVVARQRHGMACCGSLKVHFPVA